MDGWLDCRLVSWEVRLGDGVGVGRANDKTWGVGG